MTRDGRNGMSRSGSGAPIASGRKKSFGGRTPAGYGQTAGVRRRFAPLWVYCFGLLALAFLQTFAFPPDEHSVAANVTFFAAGAIVVIVVLTVAQRATHR